MELLQPFWVNLSLLTLLWIYSVWRKDASLIDLAWPLLFVSAAWIWFEPVQANWPQWTALILVVLWGARLHIYLAKRNLGHGEDRRYQALRSSYSPGFWWKSYFIVFLLQCVLAWIASIVILGALQVKAPGIIWWAGVALAIFGLLFETVGDLQLARFKANPANRNAVMNQGLWRLTRHPNYFGECCFWWGVGLMALLAFPWGLISPLLMTFLLLRVSGVSLLEKDIGERRPGYREYLQSTPAFFPDFRKLRGAR